MAAGRASGHNCSPCASENATLVGTSTSASARESMTLNFRGFSRPQWCCRNYDSGVAGGRRLVTPKCPVSRRQRHQGRPGKVLAEHEFGAFCSHHKANGSDESVDF